MFTLKNLNMALECLWGTLAQELGSTDQNFCFDLRGTIFSHGNQGKEFKPSKTKSELVPCYSRIFYAKKLFLLSVF